MYAFQVLSFIFAVIFYLLLGAGATFIALIFFRGKFIEDRKVRYSYLEKRSRGKRAKKRETSSTSIIWFMIGMGIIIYLIRPYILDIPQLITGKLNYVTGFVIEEKHESKGPNEYVFLSTGDQVKFFFSSGVSVGKEYKIGYLTHTSKALYCAELNTSDEEFKELGFPLKDIALFSGIMAVFLLLAFIGPYIKWRVFVPANIICLPTFLFFFVKYRIDNGIWFAKENWGAFGLISGIIFLLLGLLFRYLEKRRPGEENTIFFVVQLLAVSEIGFFIALVFNIK